MALLAEASAVSMTSAVSSIMSVVSTVMTTITGDTVLMTFFCASIVGIAIGIVKKLRAKQSLQAVRLGGVVVLRLFYFRGNYV